MFIQYFNLFSIYKTKKIEMQKKKEEEEKKQFGKISFASCFYYTKTMQKWENVDRLIFLLFWSKVHRLETRDF
jgi:hypothetical protein